MDRGVVRIPPGMVWRHFFMPQTLASSDFWVSACVVRVTGKACQLSARSLSTFSTEVPLASLPHVLGNTFHLPKSTHGESLVSSSFFICLVSVFFLTHGGWCLRWGHFREARLSATPCCLRSLQATLNHCPCRWPGPSRATGNHSGDEVVLQSVVWAWFKV